MGIRTWLFNRAFRNHRTNVSKESLDGISNSGQHICILHNATNDLGKIELFIKQLEEINKKVSSYTFHPQVLEEVPENAFHKKDFNWYHFPYTDRILNFINQQFDILIVINMDNNQLMTTLGALSKAKFKIGINDDNMEFYNLIVDSNNSNDLQRIIKDIKETIKKLAG